MTNQYIRPGGNGVNEEDRPSSASRLGVKFMYLALVICALAIMLLGYWATESENVLEVKNSPFPTRTIRHHTAPHGVVFLGVDLCKHKDLKGEVRTSFVSDSREIFQPLSQEKFSVGCQRREIPIMIPIDLEPDTYKIKFRVTYDINPLKNDKDVFVESQEFVVDPSSPTPVVDKQ